MVDYRKLIMHNLGANHGRFEFYYSKVVDKIVKDAPNQRIVAIFKDCLIYDDSSCDCLKEFYSKEESEDRLTKLTKFYSSNVEIFPSYAVIIQPLDSEANLLMQNKDGMAKYMFKNIRRKQQLIDEKYSIAEKIKMKQQQNTLQQNRLGSNRKYFEYQPMLNGLITRTDNLQRPIQYIRRLAFEISLSGLLEEFLQKDTQEQSNSQVVVGRVIEPIHLNDHVYHKELDQLERKRKMSQQRSNSNRGSQSPYHKQPKLSMYPPNSPQRQNLIPRSVTHRNDSQNRQVPNLPKPLTIINHSPRTLTPNHQAKNYTCLNQHTLKKITSPNSKIQLHTVRESIQIKSPMRGLSPLHKPHPLFNPSIAENVFRTLTPIRDTIIPSADSKPAKSPLFYLRESQSPKRSKPHSNFRSPRFQIKDSTNTYVTPSKNLLQTREISGSKGRLQIIQTTTITPIHIQNENISILKQEHTTARKVRESIVKKPVSKATCASKLSSPIWHSNTIEASDEKCVTLNILRDGLKGYMRQDINTESTLTLQSQNKNSLQSSKISRQKYMIPRTMIEQRWVEQRDSIKSMRNPESARNEVKKNYQNLKQL